MISDIDVNAWVDQQEMDEERDNRRFGNDDFDYFGGLSPENEEEKW